MIAIATTLMTYHQYQCLLSLPLH